MTMRDVKGIRAVIESTISAPNAERRAIDASYLPVLSGAPKRAKKNESRRSGP